MSELADNVVHFTRLLRGAGLRLGPASSIDALAAASTVNVLHREELFWALHAVLVRRPEDFDLFEQAFRLFWRARQPFNAALAELLALTRIPPAASISRRLSEAWSPPRPSSSPSDRSELDAALTFSSDEVLRTRDFDQMSAEELARAKKAVARMSASLRPIRTRRFAADPHGPVIDLARTVRESRKTFGDLAPLRFRSRVFRPPPLVVLCDISGSMGRYSEILLHFAHALLNARSRVQVFLFATRLSNVTRILRRRDPDEALARCGREVQDWSGGTRLGACLHGFNLTWSRRVLGQGAVVLLVTDGLDRDPDVGLAAEADRLHRSCRRLIWLNPLLRWEGFEPRAQGVRALLPHVDDHRPVHNLDSLEALGRILGGDARIPSPGRPPWARRERNAPYAERAARSG